MAYDDALFQLGMDLTRSSTAQKEDLSAKTAHIAHHNDDEARKDFFIERDGVRFAGTHLIIDLFGARKLDDLKHVERTLKRCVDVSGATLLHMHLHHFTPNGGVSGVAVLSESHISIHSWPEADYAALDVFMCGDAKPHLTIAVLKEAFGAENVVVREHLRGEELDQLKWQAARRPAASAPVTVAKAAKPLASKVARAPRREKAREVVAA
jgi:S-adenosylmethionine decarboxylase